MTNESSRKATLSVVATALIAIAACAHAAPPHGHRHHHGGIDLVFDGDLSVYVAVDHPDLFFHDGRFFRHRDGGWTASARFDGPFGSIAIETVPSPLRVHKHRKVHPPGQHRRHHHHLKKKHRPHKRHKHKHR